jgi:hypothetical protein
VSDEPKRPTEGERARANVLKVARDRAIKQAAKIIGSAAKRELIERALVEIRIYWRRVEGNKRFQRYGDGIHTAAQRDAAQRLAKAWAALLELVDPNGFRQKEEQGWRPPKPPWWRTREWRRKEHPFELPEAPWWLTKDYPVDDFWHWLDCAERAVATQVHGGEQDKDTSVTDYVIGTAARLLRAHGIRPTTTKRDVPKEGKNYNPELGKLHRLVQLFLSYLYPKRVKQNRSVGGSNTHLCRYRDEAPELFAPLADHERRPAQPPK